MGSGSSEATCFPCPPGFYCSQLGTVTPQMCNNGTYCQGGESAPRVCPAGAYCPATAAAPIPCPAGFYCERGTEYFAKCVNGTFCPTGSAYPQPCPGGTFGSGNPRNEDEASGCSPCGRGSFSTSESNTACLDCRPGFVCLGKTNSATPTSRILNRGYRCPKGHYCPLSSYRELPCPAGTYAKLEGTTSLSGCLRCKVGWYNSLEGQEGCRACGPSATTSADGGATTCTCLGKFRTFIKSTGSCLCQAGYKPKNGGDPEADAATDCELIVKEPCAVGVEADIEGNCVTDSKALCESQCGSQGGELVPGTGLC
jgi:hypothetical protein